MTTTTSTVKPGTEARKYYYRPLASTGGKVLKCAGFGAESEEHRAFYVPYFNTDTGRHGEYATGVQIIEGYRGDRIDAATHELTDGATAPSVRLATGRSGCLASLPARCASIAADGAVSF